MAVLRVEQIVDNITSITIPDLLLEALQAMFVHPHEFKIVATPIQPVVTPPPPPEPQ
jgi:hypothetical protein